MPPSIDRSPLRGVYNLLTTGGIGVRRISLFVQESSELKTGYSLQPCGSHVTSSLPGTGSRLYNRCAMRILVIGSGGREHALAWKLASSAHTTKLYCAPGNSGIDDVATCLPANVNDPIGLASLAESIGAELTVIGPEAPLVAGVAEAFRTQGLRMVGPSAAAARLEGSKIFTKEFTTRHSIPTARFVACDSPVSAREALRKEFQFPVVVKADGLAAGKGVRIANDQAEFDAAINEIMVERVF